MRFIEREDNKKSVYVQVIQKGRKDKKNIILFNKFLTFKDTTPEEIIEILKRACKEV